MGSKKPEHTELDKYLDKYYEAFHEGFPMYQLGRCETDEGVIEIIKRCLSEKKDAYGLGLISDDENILY